MEAFDWLGETRAKTRWNPNLLGTIQPVLDLRKHNLVLVPVIKFTTLYVSLSRFQNKYAPACYLMLKLSWKLSGAIEISDNQWETALLNLLLSSSTPHNASSSSLSINDTERLKMPTHLQHYCSIALCCTSIDSAIWSASCFRLLIDHYIDLSKNHCW